MTKLINSIRNKFSKSNKQITMAKLPSVKEEGYHKSKSNNLNDGDKLAFIETDREGDLIAVDSERAKESLKQYFFEEIGRYIDGTFKSHNDDFTDKMAKLDEKLSNMIDEKMADISTKIYERLVSHKVKEEINLIVNKKLGRVTELINDEMENSDEEYAVNATDQAAG